MRIPMNLGYGRWFQTLKNGSTLNPSYFPDTRRGVVIRAEVEVEAVAVYLQIK
jgi:hypothetical protein|uniref:Uncharacterized protein n=2 Tax=Arabidopsis thaliana TaxID=3702 RepID=Q1PFJ2_ARATH|nr:hypothetical protein At1g58150 [Arabidopsis thaliana]